MREPRRRGICPGLSAPMPTGDGLLVRLMPTEPVPPDAFIRLCEAAHRHGNGTMEISARGSLQVRGLTPCTAPLFASAVAELGIVTHEGVPVIVGLAPVSAKLSCGSAAVSPSAQGKGEEFAAPPQLQSKNILANAVDVAAELRSVIANARLELSPKVSIVVDDDGALHFDAVSADIRLREVGPVQQPRFCVGLGGDGASATWLGSIAPRDAAGAVLALLTVIAAHGPAARAADIVESKGIEAFHSISGAWIVRSPPPPPRSPAEMVGLHPGRDGTFAIGIGLAFGHIQADVLAEIVHIAIIDGVQAVRPAPDRSLLLLGVAASRVADLTACAERLGFVVRADDPKRRIAACPGAPACVSGLIPARALAASLTPILDHFRGTRRNGVLVHISGCPKGCAHPSSAALTLVGTERGCGLVRNGASRATPDYYVDLANLTAEISRISVEAGEVAYG